MFHDLAYRIRALFNRKALEREMDDELRFHFEREVEKQMRAGLAREEAARRARLTFGGIEQTREGCRQARGVALVEGLVRDVSHALRGFRRSPGFTATVVLSLALGIGANTAIFTLMDAVMWRMLPVKDPESLWAIGNGFSYSQYRLMKERNDSVDLAAYSPVLLRVGAGESAEPAVEGQLVSGGYFSLLGVTPIAGRTIGAEDDRVPNGHPVAMISYGYWKRRFNRSHSAIGSTISLCGRGFTIIGVTPPEFFGVEVGTSPDIFVPVMMQPAVMPAFENLLDRPIIYRTWLQMVGRLKPGVHADQAGAALEVLWRQELPRAKDGKVTAVGRERLSLTPAATGLSSLRRQFSQPLFILMAIVGVVLLIACANTANLVLARAAARQHEFATRLAIGASRRRLISQLLVESAVLAILGGAAGILLSRWVTQLLVTFMSSGRTPIVLDLNPDPRILAFAAAVSLSAGILFGLAPAFRATRIDLTPELKSAASRVTGGRGLQPTRILVVTQIALSLVLLGGAGLFVRSLQNLNGRDSGFDRESLLIMRVEPRGSDQRNIPGTSARLNRLYRDLAQRVAMIPGVRSASLAQTAPTARSALARTVRSQTGEEARVSFQMVYPNYFKTMGISMTAGRDFGEEDLAENSARVTVVNEAFARRVFNGANPLHQHVPFGQELYEIIGVVGDSPYASLRGEAIPLAYQTFLQTNTGRGQMTLHVRTGGDSGFVVPRIRQEISKLDAAVPLFDVHTLAAEMDGVLIRERLIALLAGFFSSLALLLACVGLYGLFAFAVVQRTNEIGIRMALGALPGEIARMFTREAMFLVLVGLAIGAPTAFAVARLASTQISGLLHGLEATDPLTISGAGVLVALVVAVAAYVPARRASRVDPLVALRNE